jgi:hypothetical protein
MLSGPSPWLLQDCLRALLAVLMNMTQNNAAGCESVVAAGVLEAVTPLLAQITQGGPRNKGNTSRHARSAAFCGIVVFYVVPAVRRHRREAM